MNANIFTSQILGTPPITRFLFLAIIALMILVYINAIQPYTLYYSSLFLRYMEVWRVITCFLYFGKPSLDVIIHITFLYRYSKMLEESFIYTSDYLYLLMIVWGTLFIVANIFNISTLGTAFSSTITYIWTRKNPSAVVQIFGFINFPAFYLPFIVPLFMLITEKKILIEDILGILVGHFYFFFKDVYPKFGQDIFKTPCFLKKLFREHSSDCCKNKKRRRPLNVNRDRSRINETHNDDTVQNNDGTVHKDETRNEDVVHNNGSVLNEILKGDLMNEGDIKILEESFNRTNVEETESLVVEKSSITECISTESCDNNKLSDNKTDENEEGWSSQTVDSD